MIYYGIVDKIPSEYQTGVYGRGDVEQSIVEKYLKEDLANDGLLISAALLLVPGGWMVRSAAALGSVVLSKLPSRFLRKSKPLTLLKGVGNEIGNELKQLHIFNKALNEDYNVKDPLFKGLFDNITFGDKAFKAMMQSDGESSLVIIERENIPSNIKHLGGQSGKFSTGLYCQHPKDKNTLLPLNNYTGLIKSMVLEETIRAYEALGAKKILIEDRTVVETKSKGKSKGVKLSVETTNGCGVLREKVYGKGTFDIKRATEDKLFIHDYPNITTVLEGRMKGNQLLEKFSERIDLGCGINTDVLGLFGGDVGFKFMRDWYFEVEFYDKNELDK